MWCLALATEFAAGQATDFSVIGRDELVRTLPLDVMGNAPSLEESLDAELEANLRRSIAEHESEAAETCRNFYCGPSRAGDAPVAGRDGYDSYPIGPVPSVDFPAAFAGEDGRIFGEQLLFDPSILSEPRPSRMTAFRYATCPTLESRLSRSEQGAALQCSRVRSGGGAG